MKELSSVNQVEELFDELYPYCRSILGKGYRDSLEILCDYIPLEKEVFLSGEKVLNWVVPKEWIIREAWIKDEEGNTVIDFADNNLYVVNYSEPVDKVVSLDELKEHLYVSNSDDDAIPYTTSYYKRRWGFCISKNELKKLNDGNYHVYIDSDFVDGELVIGEAVIPGKSKKEIFLSSYLCHPSMANDNLSGPLVMAMLYQKISRWKDRKYTYRFIICPETIGSISYLSRHGEDLKKNVHAGLVLTCLGGTDNLRYEKSRNGNSSFDQLVSQIQNEKPNSFNIIEFDPTGGSDERQYCSPGFNLPVGQFARLVYEHYKEYHTSLDTKELMGIENIIESANVIENVLLRNESERYVVNLYPYGEIKLGDYGLYPSVNSDGFRIADESEKLTEQPWFRPAVMVVLNYGDGEHSLSFCAEKLNLDRKKVEEVVDLLIEKGLIKEKEE